MTRPPKQPPQDIEIGPPPRRSRVGAVAQDTTQLGRAGFERAGFADPALVLRWREIAGADVARFASPLRFSEGAGGGVLTMRADPAAALFLRHESRALCARINQFLGRAAVARLRFVPGDVVPERARPIRNYPQELSMQDPARGFGGPDDLKEALLALARARRASGD